MKSLSFTNSFTVTLILISEIIPHYKHCNKYTNIWIHSIKSYTIITCLTDDLSFSQIINNHKHIQFWNQESKLANSTQAAHKSREIVKIFTQTDLTKCLFPLSWNPPVCSQMHKNPFRGTQGLHYWREAELKASTKHLLPQTGETN